MLGRILGFFSLLLLAGMASGCVKVPVGVQPVDGFELDRYLGRWYEVARLDHSFERGLKNVTADYSLRDDGGVKVLNRGQSIADGTWKEAEGKAYFVKGSDQGFLKVSFFGPFYGSYIVFGLDQEEYQYAFVAGPDTSYLWLLSRTPEVSEELLAAFVEKAKRLGFDTDGLIFPHHSTTTSLRVPATSHDPGFQAVSSPSAKPHRRFRG